MLTLEANRSATRVTSFKVQRGNPSARGLETALLTLVNMQVAPSHA